MFFYEGNDILTAEDICEALVNLNMKNTKQGFIQAL